MSLGDLLALVVRALDAAAIPHMLVGSMASSVYGEPRSTQDIDLVIDPTVDSLDQFLASFPEDRFYVSAAEAHRALADRDHFNLIDTTTGWKVDLIVRKDRPFSQSEFERRVPLRVLGIDLWSATPEDTILAKLEWARMGASDRQVRDAAAVLAVRADDIDNAHLDRWAVELGVSDLLARARSD